MIARILSYVGAVVVFIVGLGILGALAALVQFRYEERERRRKENP